MMRWLYLSPVGVLISIAMNLLRPFKATFMIYGCRDSRSGRFRKYTRVSTSAVIEDRKNIALGDHVWVGHMCLLDGSGGIEIGTGVHLAARTSIFTHSSHVAIRLYGADYIRVPHLERVGYVREPVIIGEFSFIGTGSILLPGVTLGRGCMVAAGSVVAASAPDFSILRGTPARIVGDTRDLDRPYFESLDIRHRYFDQEVIAEYINANEKA